MAIAYLSDGTPGWVTTHTYIKNTNTYSFSANISCTIVTTFQNAQDLNATNEVWYSVFVAVFRSPVCGQILF